MDLYNIKIDIDNYLIANKKNLCIACLMVMLGVILGCILAFGVDLDTIKESNDVYFLFLNKENVSVGASIILGIIFNFTLLCLSKLCEFTRRFSLVIVIYRAYSCFRRFILILLVFGVGCVIGVVVCAVLETLICFTFIVVYLVNNNLKYCRICDLLTDESKSIYSLLFIVLLCLGVMQTFSFNIIAIFT